MVTYTLPLDGEPTQVLRYAQSDGHQPFTAWQDSLRDTRIKAAVATRIGRLRLGLYGDYRVIDRGIWELRIHLGAGYRLYFLRDGQRVVILLCGGDKSSQRRDILKAQRYAEDYRRTR